jgi:hypothetical protein
MAAAAMAILTLAGVAAPAAAQADERPIVWRIVSLWTVIGGSAGLPSRYAREGAAFASKTECLADLAQSRDRLEAERAEAERSARRAGAAEVEYRAMVECAPRYAGTSP